MTHSVDDWEHAPETIPHSRAVRLWTDIFQGLLIAVVVLWVLDVPRRVLGLSFYTEQMLAVCLGLSLALAYIGAKGGPRPLDWVAAAASIAICLYIGVRYEPLTYEIAQAADRGDRRQSRSDPAGAGGNTPNVGRGSGRHYRAADWLMCLSGRTLPGDFQTRYVSPQRLIVYLGLDTNGMIGNILQVAVLIVVPFTLMGQVLGRTGGAAYFADLAMSGMGNFRGGAAKIAVVGSALFGMISGAAVSNVVAVGIVTIPLMARSGFSRMRAAAIEAVGSTGGQLMPPVMGAAAFIMAEFLQVSYGAVVIAAVIPALLYYAALFIHVDLEAAKHKIGAAQVDEEIPSFLEIVRSGWHFPIPIAFLISTLAWPEFFQIPIERAAIYSTAMLIVLCLLFGYRGKRVTIMEMSRAVLDTGRAALDIILIGAAAGMVVGSLSVSGIAFGLTLQLIAISGENLFILLVLTAVVSFILGMGMPTVSVYVLTATLLAPSLIKLGVTPMAAHMYVMYFGMLSMITPPVAIAAYAAANIARVSGWGTGWVSVMVGWSTFFIPFLFVLEPALLMAAPWHLIVWHVARNLLGIYMGTAAIVGFGLMPLSLPMRVLFGAAALAILMPPNAFPGADWLDWAGLIGSIAMLALNFFRSRNPRPQPASA